MNERAVAWAYLSRVAEGPCAALNQLIADCGPLAAAERVRARDVGEALLRRTAARYDEDRAEQDVHTVTELGGRLVTPDDEEWPSWKFLAFDNAPDPDCVAPVALWARGPIMIGDGCTQAAALVGTRAASRYGEHVATEFGHDLAEHGFTVVSGAAYGIDAAAHRGALAGGGTTMAVLAHGIDSAYPAGNAALIGRIATEGAIVSEYPPGTRPARHRFLARNRLVAALSDAVVVVEAGARSGAANTAKWGRLLGRSVCAVPGSVTSASAVGCHQLIQAGHQLVTSGADIRECVGPLGLFAPDATRHRDPLDDLTEVQRAVYDALPARGGRDVGELALESGLAVADIRGGLVFLEIAGLVTAHTAGWIRMPVR